MNREAPQERKKLNVAFVCLRGGESEWGYRAALANLSREEKSVLNMSHVGLAKLDPESGDNPLLDAHIIFSPWPKHVIDSREESDVYRASLARNPFNPPFVHFPRNEGAEQKAVGTIVETIREEIRRRGLLKNKGR
ncbi:Uncharacterised protein [Candidatus Norongarragalina meridionalis]|nr:Uncharacterised protein [Candidatus Norongarragalina meridionalis]